MEKTLSDNWDDYFDFFEFFGQETMNGADSVKSFLSVMVPKNKPVFKIGDCLTGGSHGTMLVTDIVHFDMLNDNNIARNSSAAANIARTLSEDRFRIYFKNSTIDQASFAHMVSLRYLSEPYYQTLVTFANKNKAARELDFKMSELLASCQTVTAEPHQTKKAFFLVGRTREFWSGYPYMTQFTKLSQEKQKPVQVNLF